MRARPSVRRAYTTLKPLLLLPPAAEKLPGPRAPISERRLILCLYFRSVLRTRVRGEERLARRDSEAGQGASGGLTPCASAIDSRPYPRSRCLAVPASRRQHVIVPGPSARANARASTGSLAFSRSSIEAYPPPSHPLSLRTCARALVVSIQRAAAADGTRVQFEPHVRRAAS